jgi:tetratricopeptide (TPR) repeat protein
VLIRGLIARKELAGIDQQITILESLSSKPLAQGFRAMVALLRGDYSASAALLREVMHSDDVQESSRATSLLANLEADRGEIERARTLLGDGILKDRETSQDGFAAEKTIALAFLDGMAENHALAAARARQAVSMRRSPLVIVQAVTVLARNGSSRDALSLMNSFPAGEGPKHEADLLRMRGEILAARGEFKQALDVLERAARMDRPQVPKEYLARALDLAGDRLQAKLVYEQIADTPFPTWIVEDQWPATRLLARQQLKEFEGRIQ